MKISRTNKAYFQYNVLTMMSNSHRSTFIDNPKNLIEDGESVIVKSKVEKCEEIDVGTEDIDKKSVSATTSSSKTIASIKN